MSLLLDSCLINEILQLLLIIIRREQLTFSNAFSRRVAYSGFTRSSLLANKADFNFDSVVSRLFPVGN